MSRDERPRPYPLQRALSSPQDVYEAVLRANNVSVDQTWLQHWQSSNEVAAECPCFSCIMEREGNQETSRAEVNEGDEDAGQESWRDRIRRLDAESDRMLGRRFW